MKQNRTILLDPDADAEFLTKEFEPEFTQTDLTSPEAFMGACKVSVNNQQSRPFSFKAKVLYP